MKATLKGAVTALFVVGMCASMASASLEKGPYLQNVTENSIVVCFEGGLLDFVNGSVEWGPTQSLGNTVNGSGVNRRFELTLNGLQPNTRYYYKIHFGGDTSAVYSFVTAPRFDEPYSLCVFGDTRTNHNDHQAVANAIHQTAPSIVINTGDLVDLGINPSDWTTFFGIEKTMMAEAAMYAAYGNHEIGSDVLGIWPGLWVSPNSPVSGETYYAFRYGSIYFIFLDTNTLLGPAGAQYQWLDNQIQQAKANPRIQFIIPILHHPVYSSSNHGSTSYLQFLRTYFQNNGIQVVFNGHDHLYQHNFADGIHWMVTGGGGAPRYGFDPEPWVVAAEEVLHYGIVEVDGPTLVYTAYRVDGSTIDTFTLTSTVPTPTPTPTFSPVPTATPTHAPTETPTMSLDTPTPVPTATNTPVPPTDTPTLEPTATPAPSTLGIPLAGYWNSQVTDRGGLMHMVAVITDPVSRVYLTYNGVDLGLDMKDDGQSGDFDVNDMIYGFTTSFGPSGATGRFLLGIEAAHSPLLASWPHLTVE